LLVQYTTYLRALDGNGTPSISVIMLSQLTTRLDGHVIPLSFQAKHPYFWNHFGFVLKINSEVFAPSTWLEANQRPFHPPVPVHALTYPPAPRPCPWCTPIPLERSSTFFITGNDKFPAEHSGLERSSIIDLLTNLDTAATIVLSSEWSLKLI
jgi:hypothetical protein